MQKIIEFELNYLPPSVNSVYLRSKHGGVFISQRARDFKKRIEEVVKVEWWEESKGRIWRWQ